MVWIVVAGFVVAVLLLVALRRWVRGWSRAVERSDADTPAKLHRMQRAVVVVSFAGALLALAAAAWTNLRAGRHHGGHESVAAALAPLPLLVLGVGAPFVVRRPLRESVGRLRDADPRPKLRRRWLVAAMAILVVAAMAIGVVLALLPLHGIPGVLLRVGVLGVMLMLVQLMLTPLLLLALRAEPAPADFEARSTALAQRMGVRVRGFRVLPTRSQRLANAMQLGALPGHRYIAVTDYLLDNFTPEQVDAVVAHELAHAAGHHVLKKLAAWFGVWGGLQVVVVLLVGTGAAPVALAVTPVLLWISFIVVQGALGIRLERRADDRATEVVGAEPMAEALERLGELNHAQLRTSRGWNLLTQHPGLGQRIERAASRAGHPYPAAAPAAGEVPLPGR